jgi:histidinol-phosphate aminotransferase
MIKRQVAPRTVVETIKPYAPGWPDRTPAELCRLLDRSEVAKLSFNESPYGPSPKAVQAMQQAACQVHLYYDMEAKALRQKIAERNGVAIDNVYIGNGGDEAIALLVNAFVAPGDEVVLPWPTFGQYANATTIMDGVPVKVPVRADDLKADLPAMLAAITPRTKIIFLCNPNNPTGVVVGGAELRGFLAAIPSHVLVGLDEAYIDYVGDDSFVSGLSLLGEFPNVVTIRTFSKVYGLAGMRVGYGIGHSDVVTLVQRVRPLFNVNTLAQFGAMAALDDAEFVELSVRQNAAQRQWLSERLTELGWRVLPSQTNFIFVDTGVDAAPLADAARATGFIIRAGAGWGFPSFLRISLGTPQQNADLVEVLKNLPMQQENR